jgi:hypothetical protein
MNARSRQFAILGAVAAAAVVFAVVRSGDDRPTERPAAPSNRTGGGAAAAASAPSVVDLDLERLHSERAALPESQRDPFRFRPAPAPPPPPRVATVRPAPRPEEFVAPVPAGPPPPPPIAVKFFGLVVLRGERVAMFSDTRGNTFYGKEGDIIEGRYRVRRIGTDSVELEYLDGRGRQTIRLTGQ